VEIAYYITKNFPIFLFKVHFKKLPKYRVKQPKKYRRYQKQYFLKSIDVTDNGTKKVLRYRTVLLLYYGTAHLCILATSFKKCFVFIPDF